MPSNDDAQRNHVVEFFSTRHGDLSSTLPMLETASELEPALRDLIHSLTLRHREIQELDKLTLRITAGALLDDILDYVYTHFDQIIPYNRIGLALIEDNGQTVLSRWARSHHDNIRLGPGYAAPLEGSSLQTIIQTGQPRIINDLERYLADKPESQSTRLIVAEGIRSSLTCPLNVNGLPVGFIFFSSDTPNTYSAVHSDLFLRIADQLSIIVDKGNLVSELAAHQNEIERQNVELRHLNELKNEFVGMAAHDLRNPIASIQMMAQLLLEPLDWMADEDRRGLLQDMLSQTQHMLALLTELLDVTQIESGRLDLNLRQVQMDAFMARAVKRHTQLAAPKGTQVILEAVDSGYLNADPVRLRQAIDNLISNAVKYSPAGSTVRVSARQTGAEWRVSVRDEGPGITPRDRERLFQDFARLSAQPTGGESSTGLGLAITRRVVDAHGGVLDVDSEPGSGADFWFTLPAS